MLERTLRDLRIIGCAGKTVQCLNIARAAVCVAAVGFAVFESVKLIRELCKG